MENSLSRQGSIYTVAKTERQEDVRQRAVQERQGKGEEKVRKRQGKSEGKVCG